MTQRLPERRLAIFAGGKGLRLLGPEGGSKALFQLNQRPLIDYTLDHVAALGVTEVIVVADADDRSLRMHLEGRREIRFVTSERPGSAGAMAAVLNALGSSHGCFVTTCDTVIASAAVERYAASVEENGIEAAVLLATRYRGESTPVWIHASADARVTSLGKDVEPSVYVFANLRWLPPTALSWMSANVTTGDSDSRWLGSLINACVTPTLMHEEWAAFDIDDLDDVHRVEVWLSANLR